MKKLISILVAVCMLASVSVVSAKNTYNDTQGHWAEKQIDSWSGYGVISGYDGEFSPNRSITRGEFAVVLSRLMAYQKTLDNTFSDLDEAFYTDSVLKLHKAGVMQGYENKINPTASLTREEAASMISRALGIEAQDKADKSFNDYESVSDWAKPSMNAMINLGLLNGSNGNLNPKNTITRAEVVTILDNAVLPVLTSGDFENIDTNKIVVISADNVTIKDSVINGKIIITQGIKEGTLKIVNSEVKGEISIDNDREKFITLENTTVADENILSETAFTSEKSEEKEDESSGSSSESSGSSSGGSSGGGGGGGGGSNKKNYKKINAEMIKNLKEVSTDVEQYLKDDNDTFTLKEKNVLTKVKYCVDEAIKYEEKAEITGDFIKKTFSEEIKEVKGIYEEMKAKGDGSDKKFIEKVGINLNLATIEWLLDALDVNPDDYLS